MTQTAYLSGQQSAEAALKKQAAPKREDPPLTEDSGGQPWVQPQGQPGMDPRMLATLNEVVKRQKATEAQLGEIQAENTRLKDERREREVGSRVLKAISEEGLDAPDSVLLLIRNQCAVDFVPDPSDANELQVVRSGGDPHVRMPVDGPGTYTTVPEFVKRWANSPEGLRYKRVPEGAKQGAGVSGGGGGNTQIGKGPLHIDNKRAAMKELGFI